MKTEFEGPMAAICSSARKTVMSGWEAAPVASMSVTCVMARDVGGMEEREQDKRATESNKVMRPRKLRKKCVRTGSVALMALGRFGWSLIARGDYIS
jgi:hypothetical protein